MTSTLLRCFVVIVLFPFITLPSWGQTQEKDPEPSTPRWLGVSFEHRARFEKMTNRFRIDELGATRVLAFRTRLQIGIQELIDPMRFYVEIQDSRSELNDDPFVIPARHINKLDFKQVQIQLVSDRFFGKDLPTLLQIGRFTMDLGGRRLAARNQMRNTTNAFDGLHWWLGTNENWMLHTFVTRPVLLEPEKLDSSDNRRYFWGGYLELKKVRRFQTDLYYFDLREDERTQTQRQYSTIGGRLYKNPSPGELDYEIESAWQFGSNKDRDHFAHFQHGELGYFFDSLWDSRISLHYDYVSGDPDPEDDKFGQFDTLFGARRFEFNPTGIYGPFFRGNLHTPGARIVVIPSSQLELMASHRVFWLAQSKAVWFGSGLRDPTGESGSFFGNHIEARLRWKPTQYLLVETGYAHFFKGSYLDRVPGSPRTPDSDFFYIAAEIQAPLLPR